MDCIELLYIESNDDPFGNYDGHTIQYTVEYWFWNANIDTNGNRHVIEYSDIDKYCITVGDRFSHSNQFLYGKCKPNYNGSSDCYTNKIQDRESYELTYEFRDTYKHSIWNINKYNLFNTHKLYVRYSR